MAPAAVAIPQFAACPNPNKLPNDSPLRESSEWNNMGDSALDFDLLAEYLLEDMGAGGFDFGASAEAISPPAIDALKTQPAPVPILPDPGVVTPNPNPDQPPAAVVDPLADPVAAPQLQHPQVDAAAVAAAPLPGGGDLAGELSQVQQMITATQQQQQQQTNAAVAPQPQPLVAQVQPQPLAQAQMAQPQTQMAQPQIQMAHPVVTQPVAPATMAGRHSPLRPQPKPQSKLQPKPAPAAVAAPIPQQRSPMPKPTAMAQPQPPHKRPRVHAAPGVPKAKPSYSFAASVASVNGTGSRAGAGHAPLPLPPAVPGGRQALKSQAQIDRRRERNRILARRTRLRKKFFFESLQKDVADLQRENAALKSIVRARLKPDDARAVLSRCDANERLPSAVQPDGGDVPPGMIAGVGGGPGARKLDREDFSLIRCIQNSQQCFIITDPSLHDNPIVYASDDFLTLTGYSQEEVLGRNCRFLQGTETCQDKVARIRDGVRAGGDVNVTLANYKSDGSPFWNSLFIAALRDADNNIVNFIGVIVKVSGPEPGDSEYGKVLK